MLDLAAFTASLATSSVPLAAFTTPWAASMLDLAAITTTLATSSVPLAEVTTAWATDMAALHASSIPLQAQQSGLYHLQLQQRGHLSFSRSRFSMASSNFFCSRLSASLASLNLSFSRSSALFALSNFVCSRLSASLASSNFDSSRSSAPRAEWGAPRKRFRWPAGFLREPAWHPGRRR